MPITSKDERAVFEPFESRMLLAGGFDAAVGEAVSVAAADQAVIVASVNRAGSPITLLGGGGRWRGVDLSVHGGPARVDGAEAWVDVRTGLARVAASWADGLGLYEQDGRGAWSYRDLTDQLSGATPIVEGLTRFTGVDGLTRVAGLNARGELVMYEQTTAPYTVAPARPGYTPLPLPWETVFIREVRNDFLYEYAAITTLDAYGWVIQYGPRYYQLHPLVQSFVRAHEYAHALYAHQNPTVEARQYNEIQADLYAAEVWAARDLNVVEATAQFFESQGPIQTSVYYQSGTQIAANIRGRAAEVVQKMSQPPLPPVITSNNWRYINLTTQHLAPQGLRTPEFRGELVSYVTGWNGLNIAGLDENGDVHSVWWAPGLDRWRADNLSAMTGADPFEGGLTVYVTPWGGINIAGTDGSGVMNATWWAPGMLTWRNDALIGSEAPRLDSRTVSSYVSPWGGLNVVGLDEQGGVTVYWWAPGMAGWVATSLTNEIAGSPAGPTSPMRAAVSRTGLTSLVGARENGNIVRFFWGPGQDRWSYEDITFSERTF